MALGLSYVQRGRLGALRRYELYGNPGTPKGRSKGGRRAGEFFRLHPEIARERGFSTLKDIKIPPRGVDLSAFIGIMLGDGGIRSKYQFTVSLNFENEREYADYVGRLIKRLFSVEHIIHKRKDSKAADIVVSSVRAVDFLLKQGLLEGNKIKSQVDIPAWIKENPEYQKACLRGLFDTDGSIYVHRYKVNNKEYSYTKMNFTSRSRPLLTSVHGILSILGIKAFIHGDNVYINSREDVNKYTRIIGTSNPKFIDRWQSF